MRRYAKTLLALLFGTALVLFLAPQALAGAACPADCDGNGVVDVDDLTAVILDWGTDGSGNGADIDGSGLVDVDDLTEVILGWGPCP
jgi:hypothetical protein